MSPSLHDSNGNCEGERVAVWKSDPEPFGSASSALVAIDLGAESCRISLLRWVNGQPEIQLVHRFANAPVKKDENLYWDLASICNGVELGLRMCGEIATEGIAAIGVDGWAVDYVRLDDAGMPRGNPFCYRDERTITAQKEVHARISSERLYELTGIQILPLNTLYQLHADGSGSSVQSAPWLNLPEFILYYLGGKSVSEYTNATHSQLLSMNGAEWCEEIFASAGLDVGAAPHIVMPGSDVGELQGPLKSLPAFATTKLIATACHDTASAIAGIPFEGSSADWAFISSGTWSLIGRVFDSPCVSAAAREANFSNEGGIGGKINFLKNVNGMWLLQQCISEWQQQGHKWSLESLIEKSHELGRPQFLIQLDDPDLLLPGNMLERITRHLVQRNLPTISREGAHAPEVANLIFHSLAARYAEVISDLVRITGHPIHRIYIIGGGSRNTLLNKLTEQATGLPVLTGSAESATIGNFSIQLAKLEGSYSNELGVNATAVAKWAGVLNSQIASSGNRQSAGSAALHV